MIQHTTPIVGPLTTDPPLETETGWQRQPPDPTRRRGIITALAVAASIVAPVVVPDTTQAVTPLAWRATYPDRIARVHVHASRLPFASVAPVHVPRVTSGSDDIGGAVIATGSVPILQYQAFAAPIIVPAESFDWGSSYPAIVPRAKRLVETPSAPIAPLYLADLTVPPPTFACWPSYPERVWPRRGLHVSQQQATPARDQFDAPPPTTAPEGSFQARYPDQVRRRALSAASMPAFSFDAAFTAPEASAVTALSWAPRYPDRVPPPAGLRSGQQQAFAFDRFDAPTTAEPSPALSWSPRFVDRHSYARPLAPYTWAQPMFAVVTRVPVMSWTGHFPDLVPLVSRVSIGARSGISAPVETPIAPAESLWPATYPSTVPGRPRSLAALVAQAVAPVYVADVTTPTPALSWSPQYPDAAPGRPRRLAALVARTEAPVVVPDITVLAPTLSWRATFVDRVSPRPGLAPAQQQAFAVDAQFTAPAEVVAPDLAAPVYPDRVHGRTPLVPLEALCAPILIPDVTLTVPRLSWAPVMPAWSARLTMRVDVQPDPPEPVFVPDTTQTVPPLAWKAVYPDVVRRVPRWMLTAVTLPERLPDAAATVVTIAKTAIVGSYATTTAVTGSFDRTTAITGSVEE